MTLLRSLKVVSHSAKSKSKSTSDIEPITPEKLVETMNKSSHQTTPPISQNLGLAGSVSNGGLRRSARLSSNSTSSSSSSYNVVVQNVRSRRKPKVVKSEEPVHVNGTRVNVTKKDVPMDLDLNLDGREGNGISNEQIDIKEARSLSNVKSRRLFSLDVQKVGTDSVREGDLGTRCLKLQSAKKIINSGINNVANDIKLSAANADEMKTEEIDVDSDFNVPSDREGKAASLESGEEYTLDKGMGVNVMENESVAVPMELNTKSTGRVGNCVSVSDMATGQFYGKEVLRLRESGIESVQDGDVGNRCLELRSGKKVLSRGNVNFADDHKAFAANTDEVKIEEIDSEADFNGANEGSVTVEVKGGSSGISNGVKKDLRRFSAEDKKKGVSVDVEEMEINVGDDVKGTIKTDTSRLSIRDKGKEKVIEVDTLSEKGNGKIIELDLLSTLGDVYVEVDLRNSVNGTLKRNRSRLNTEEKGKGKVIEIVSSSSSSDSEGTNMEVEMATYMDMLAAETGSLEHETIPRAGSSSSVNHKEMYKRVAKKNASRFAYFSHQEEKEDRRIDDEDELEQPQTEANEEDWPGPFSTAMKIIRERAANMPPQKKRKTESVPLLWVPKDKQRHLMKVAPSLQDLCMEIMAQNVDAIASLDSVPDVLRHKLTQVLCNLRKMNHHFFDLLASGSPTEIRVQDCSWLDDEQFTKTFERTDPSKLTVLQLDQCGRCLPDYVLFSTLAHFPNKLSALTNISLKGACRLSDAGLKALVASAPALRSINLGCCSLLTSDSIINLADKLGTVLKELYLDECFDIDAKHILPALLKMEQLEVLSFSHSETVDNSFIIQFVAVRGLKMKELVLANCTKLTDKALGAIAKSCPRLCAIDLTHVCRLTDKSLGHLANGCQTIQTLKFCRNKFSDEAVAAYLEACGAPLRELSLNHVNKVAHHTALSLAKHSRNLQHLNLSWCREMTNEALGLIVDSCLSLKMLKLFGCTQITNVFTDGHSNEGVKIIGLEGSKILKNIEVPDLLPLRYSSV